jgi:glycosyltransferase involved in cell wall biosynthesis
VATLHILTPEYPPQVGGVADYTRSIACGLAAAGEDVHVWCPPPGRQEPAARFSIHPDLGEFRAPALARTGQLLDQFPRPRRLLVQWVPHGFGFRAMNIRFCLWLLRRARGGDQIELMVHEPYLAFWEGTWRQTAAAAVHRLMTIMLLRAAQRVWVAIPAWAAMWKPYALGRRVPFAWLPIPSSLRQADSRAVSLVRSRLARDSRPLVGHLGTYGPLVGGLLNGVLPEILGLAAAPRVMLIGQGSEEFLRSFIGRHPQFVESLCATGALNDEELAAHVAACDVLVQPYPDGISSRRTSAMAGLHLGVPVVTTRGRLTESLWPDSGAVRLTEVGQQAEMAAQVKALLAQPDSRRLVAEAGRALYRRTFDLSHTIDALRGAGSAQAA